MLRALKVRAQPSAFIFPGQIKDLFETETENKKISDGLILLTFLKKNSLKNNILEVNITLNRPWQKY